MSDPIVEASTSGWIAKHRDLYLADGEAGHLWDSTPAGGPGPLPTLLLILGWDWLNTMAGASSSILM